MFLTEDKDKSAAVLIKSTPPSFSFMGETIAHKKSGHGSLQHKQMMKWDFYHLKNISRIKGLICLVDHISPLLRSLHWLFACQRIDFKILLLVQKTLNGLEPKNLFLICCSVMNHPDLSGFLFQESKLNMENQHVVFMLHIYCTNLQKTESLLQL